MAPTQPLENEKDPALCVALFSFSDARCCGRPSRGRTSRARLFRVARIRGSVGPLSRFRNDFAPSRIFATTFQHLAVFASRGSELATPDRRLPVCSKLIGELLKHRSMVVAGMRESWRYLDSSSGSGTAGDGSRAAFLIDLTFFSAHSEAGHRTDF